MEVLAHRLPQDVRGGERVRGLLERLRQARRSSGFRQLRGIVVNRRRELETLPDAVEAGRYQGTQREVRVRHPVDRLPFDVGALPGFGPARALQPQGGLPVLVPQQT